MSQQQHANFVTSSLSSAGYAPGLHLDRLVDKAVKNQRHRPDRTFVSPSHFFQPTKDRVVEYLDAWIGRDLLMEEIEEMVEDSFGQEGVEVLSDIFSSDKTGAKPGDFYFSSGLLCKVGESEGFKGGLRRFLERSLGKPFVQGDFVNFIEDYTPSVRKQKRLHWEAKKIFCDRSSSCPQKGQYFINKEGVLWRWSV